MRAEGIAWGVQATLASKTIHNNRERTLECTIHFSWFLHEEQAIVML
jgi:hypothetical protein